MFVFLVIHTPARPQSLPQNGHDIARPLYPWSLLSVVTVDSRVIPILPSSCYSWFMVTLLTMAHVTPLDDLNIHRKNLSDVMPDQILEFSPNGLALCSTATAYFYGCP